MFNVSTLPPILFSSQCLLTDRLCSAWSTEICRSFKYELHFQMYASYSCVSVPLTSLCKHGVHIFFKGFGISDAKIMQREISTALQAVLLCSVKHESTLLTLCESCKVRTFLLLTLVKFFLLCSRWREREGEVTIGLDPCSKFLRLIFFLYNCGFLASKSEISHNNKDLQQPN